MTEQRVFDDPVLELARVMGGGPEGVLDLADVTDDEAEVVLAVIEEVEREAETRDLKAQLGQMGYLR